MNLDPLGIQANAWKIGTAWLSHPRQALTAQQNLAFELGMLGLNAAVNAVGMLTGKNGAPGASIKVAEGDQRFADPAWHTVPAYSQLMQQYLTYTRWLEHAVYHTPGVSRKECRSAAFWTRQWFNALAPSNFFLTNPVAVRGAVASGGASLARGAAKLWADIQAGDLQMTDTAGLTPGRELATTPGAVVFRNELMELIQYRPTTAQVRAVPLVLIPPWINKYYILDLTEKKSMVRHLVAQGFSVFIVSWKNPGAELADAGIERYLTDGVLKAIELARAICGAPQVHACGYCIGGSALSTLMGWLSRRQPDQAQLPVAHWTLLSSLADFSRPGDIEALINPQALANLDAIMARQGYLDKQQLSASFRLLRPNSLIWHYFVHKYLYGETMPTLDVLCWNGDGTRLPRALHAFCLRQFYVENNLARPDAIVLDGTPVDLARVSQPLYAVGTTEDHITPWKQVFKTAALVAGPVRFVLSSSGHILGIVNPPGPASKRQFWAGAADGEHDGRAWRTRQTRQAGSWWSDWIAWLDARCGAPRAPPPLGLPGLGALCDAPGTYVLER